MPQNVFRDTFAMRDAIYCILDAWMLLFILRDFRSSYWCLTGFYVFT